MNFLKKILGYESESQSANYNPADEIFAFSGQAYLASYENGEKTEIFSISLIQFRKNPEKLFSYSIYFKNLGQPKPEIALEYIFPIHSNMNLKSLYENEPEETISFVWNLNQTVSLCLEFRDDNNGLANAVLFKDFLCKLIYETVFSKSCINVQSENDYLKYCKEIDIPKHETKPEQKKPETNDPPKLSKTNRNSKEEFTDLSKILPEFSAKKGTLLCNAGTYYSLDSKEVWTLLSHSIIFLLTDEGEFKYSFSLHDSHRKCIYKKAVTTELSYIIDEEKNMLTWLDFTNAKIQLLAMQFDSFGITKTLKFLLNQCLFESNTKEYLKDAIKKGEELEFTEKFIGQDAMEIEEEVIQEFINDGDIHFRDTYSFIPNKKEDMENRTFSQAKVYDRTFLSKGSVVSVFKTDDDENHLDLIFDLPELRTFGNKPLIPKKLLLHEADCKVLILDENENKKVSYFDIEKGKVISELQADSANSIVDIAPESKHSNLTNNPLFLGINGKNLFKLDPRLNSKNAACASKIYSSNYHFNSLTANAQGNFAVGNDRGEIRLYKDMGQNAKNLYRGLGDPILSLDTTKDGRWILATCKTYLLFVPAFSKDKNAFQTTIKNVEKPSPCMLTIQPKDMAKMGIKEVSFVNGRFDDSEKEKEQYIVVGCANFLVTWSIKKVIQKKILDYEFKRLDQKIVNNEFKFNSTEKLLVAFPNELRLHQAQIM